jgi:hypothetical protein
VAHERNPSIKHEPINKLKRLGKKEKKRGGRTSILLRTFFPTGATSVVGADLKNQRNFRIFPRDGKRFGASAGHGGEKSVQKRT